jgi:hypothetical protein
VLGSYLEKKKELRSHERFLLTRKSLSIRQQIGS